MSLTPDLLEQRLIDFAAAICQEVRRLPRDIAGTHVAKQLVRCGTSPAASYAEARSAESKRDFVHKLQLCLKELRETRVWLRMSHAITRRTATPDRLATECSELIRILGASVNTTLGIRKRKQGTEDDGAGA